MVSAPPAQSTSAALPAPVPLISPNRPRTTIYEVPERGLTLPTGSVAPDEYEAYAEGRVPIVIDNGQLITSMLLSYYANSRVPNLTGSSVVRAGYSNMSAPPINTESVISKYRDRKSNRPILLAGNDAYLDATSRSNIKPICEEGVVCNWDTMVRAAFPRVSAWC